MKDLSLPLLLDGATGTQLQALGMPAGACTELWALDNPDAIRRIQSAYAQAGSDAVLAPTFTANSLNLAQHGAAGRTGELNRSLTALSRSAVGPDVLVAGDLTSTGQLPAPYGEADFEQLYEIYLEQARFLEAAGVDFFIMETTTNLTEARAALLACRAASKKPVFVSFTCDANGRTFTGSDVLAALVTLQAMGADAFGLNCSTGPEEMLPQLRRLGEYAAIPLIAKPNAGLPQTENGKTVYHCPPEEFVALVPALLEAGVRIFGGCCGTTPEHIAALRCALDAQPCPPLPRREAPVLLASERKFFSLEGLETAEPIDCTEDFSDDAMDADDEALFCVRLDSRQALDCFLEGCYAVAAPLCLLCGDARLLEAALRAFQGVAAAPKTCGIPAPELQRLHETYGLVLLD